MGFVSKQAVFFVKMIVIVVSIGFAILSIINGENWIFRVCAQAGLGLTLLINGLQALILEKKKITAFFAIGTAIFLFYVMVFTINVGIQLGKL